ncbi:Kynureninase (L-kynurenine hydrolase) [Ceratobasidium sp. 392]|nr:Kynureninase (L-kynurenine hydrolase) [Ceratobasidium sp. 392]
MTDILSAEYAQQLDAQDPLGRFRDEFRLPTNAGIKADLVPQELKDAPCRYFVGNSLGPLPKRAQKILSEEVEVWATSGVEGHFAHRHGRNWKDITYKTGRALAMLTGAKESEVITMGTLTANLHLMISTFYKPSGDRYKILCESKAFPSDQYAFASQTRRHGYDPKDAVIELAPREDEFYLREDDILAAIQKDASSIALVLFSGIQYYTGQLFPMEKITKAAHDAGAICGWDLAHAIGNVPMKLHDWDADFAVWCTYKYLNSGPGGIAGLFVHDKWTKKLQIDQAGWWGHNNETRFQMGPVFDPIPGAHGFQQSNPSALNIATLLGSLEVFEDAGGITAIREKAVKITAYLESLLKKSTFYRAQLDSDPKAPVHFTILTPADPEQRGTQLSLALRPVEGGTMPKVFAGMQQRGVIGDERQPDVIRLAPVPLYVGYEDCRQAALALEAAIKDISK